MGVGHGAVYEIDVLDKIIDGAKGYDFKTLYWGHRMDWNGNWTYGYADLRDAPTNDPEYQEYVRLKKKFDIR